MAEMNYDKSPAPKGRFVSSIDPDHAITLDERDKLNYASAASEGRVEIQIPAPPGSPRETETLHARDFGQHIITRIESAMSQQGYMRSGPQQDGPGVFAHYCAVARGAQLLDRSTLKNMQKLSDEYAAEADQAEFYSMVVKPWLGSLSPKRR